MTRLEQIPSASPLHTVRGLLENRWPGWNGDAEGREQRSVSSFAILRLVKVADRIYEDVKVRR